MARQTQLRTSDFSGPSVEIMMNETTPFRRKLYEIMEIHSPANLHGFDDANWESICATNYFTEQMRKDDEEAGPIRYQE
jgi:hypothetical protein